MYKKLAELLEQASLEAGKHIRDNTKKILAEKGRFNSKEDIDRRSIYEIEAQYLLEKGVIVPPCNIGDTVYRIVKMSTGVIKKPKVLYKDGKVTAITTPCEPTIKYFIRSVEVTKNNFFDVCENFDKTVFPTKEEAQTALGGVEGK